MLRSETGGTIVHLLTSLLGHLRHMKASSDTCAHAQSEDCWRVCFNRGWCNRNVLFHQEIARSNPEGAIANRAQEPKEQITWPCSLHRRGILSLSTLSITTSQSQTSVSSCMRQIAPSSECDTPSCTSSGSNVSLTKPWPSAVGSCGMKARRWRFCRSPRCPGTSGGYRGSPSPNEKPSPDPIPPASWYTPETQRRRNSAGKEIRHNTRYIRHGRLGASCRLQCPVVYRVLLYVLDQASTLLKAI